MKACICGKEVRLGVYRISVNRRQGVGHYIEHADRTPLCSTGQWDCVMLKPYPKEELRPRKLMCDRWEATETNQEVLARLVKDIDRSKVICENPERSS